MDKKDKLHHTNPPFHAYKGDNPYIFVSYAHIDADRVFPELKRFHNQGYPIWYDDGIGPANEWPKEIEEALLKSSLFVVFISGNAVESKNVRNEINLAIDEEIPVIAIYLEETELKHGLKLRLSSIQSIFKFLMPVEEYVFKYTSAFKSEGGFESSKKSEIRNETQFHPITQPEIRNELKHTTITPFTELEKYDNIVLKSIGDFILKNNILSLSFEDIVKSTKEFNLTNENVAGSIEFLNDLNYIQYTPLLSGHPVNIRFTYQGIILYCKYYVDNFKYLVRKIYSGIINDNLRTNNQIIEKTKIERMIVNGIFDCLEDQHYIKITKTMDGTFIIHKISENGKRYMKKLLR